MPSHIGKFEAAVKIAVGSLDKDLMTAVTQDRNSLYKAMKNHGLSWDAHTQMWAASKPKASKFTNEDGCATGKVTIRITTHQALMHVIADRIERSLVKRGSKILGSSNFVRSKRGNYVHVFITALWPSDEEDTE